MAGFIYRGLLVAYINMRLIISAKRKWKAGYVLNSKSLVDDVFKDTVPAA